VSLKHLNPLVAVAMIYLPRGFYKEVSVFFAEDEFIRFFSDEYARP